MKGRDILKSLTEAQKPAKGTAPKQQPRPSGSVRSLKTELDKIADEAASARDLRASIEKEGRIVEIDPNLVDGADIADRIPLDNDEQFDVLKAAILASGQQVPILIRLNPQNENRYQAAYGHRRLRAARELGIKVRALVQELSDQQMVMAQGQENGPRQDLSFIERALYALRLLKHGYDRELVCHALGVDKPEVSRLLQVAEGIDLEIILAIGPARKVGRPRWIAMAKALQVSKTLDAAKNLIRSEDFVNEADSNYRFESLLKLKTKLSSKKPSASPNKVPIKGSANTQLGWIQKTRGGVTIALRHNEFSEFIREKLPDLLSEFERTSPLKK